MARYVIVDPNSDTIVNAIDWNGATQWGPPQGQVSYLSDKGDIGWKWNNGNPINPNPAPPVVVPPPLLLTTDQKLALIGLTVAQLKAALGLP